MALELAYGRDAFHPAGVTNHLTETLRTDMLFKR
jgi:hypothetical protein